MKRICAFLDNCKKYEMKYFDCKIDRRRGGKKEKLWYIVKKREKKKLLRYSKFSFLLKIIANDY